MKHNVFRHTIGSLNSKRKNAYKGLTIERVKREQVFEHLTDKEAEKVISILEKYSICMFPAMKKIH